MSNLIGDRTTTIYCRDGTSETLPADQARYRAYLHPEEWSLTPPPPLNWEREIPRYRATRDLQPSPNARHRHEPPLATIFDNNVWQHGEKPLARGDEITTTQWPHSSFRPLNFSAQQVLAFFNGVMKSRLPRSPWYAGQVRLDNGLSGGVIGLADVRPPQIQPMNLRPVA